MNISNMTDGYGFGTTYDKVVEFSMYFTIMVGLVGLLGNLLTVRLIFPHVREKSIYLMFLLLALCDSFVIVGSGAEFIIYSLGTDSDEISQMRLAGCHVVYLLYYVASELSSWILVLIATERIIVLYFPFRGPAYFTPRYVSLYIVFIVLGLFVINFQYFGGLRPAKDMYTICEGKTDIIDFYYNSVYPKLQVVCYSLAPSALLLVQNILLAQKMRQLQGQVFPAPPPQNVNMAPEHSTQNHHHPQQQPQQQPQHHQEQHQQQPTSPTPNMSRNNLALPLAGTKQKRNRADIPSPSPVGPPHHQSHGPLQSVAQMTMFRLVKTTLLLSLSFIILTVPLSVVTCMSYNAALVYKYADEQMDIAFVLTQLLSFINHCINCFLYCLSGPKYRKHLLKLLGCK